MARQTIVSTQQAERITDRALRHIRPIFGKCYGYPARGHPINPEFDERERSAVNNRRALTLGPEPVHG